MKKYFWFLNIAIIFCAASSHAQINQTKEIQTSQTFGDYTVHYNVFNSKTIPAEIAETYHLKRGSNVALVNIAITKKLPDAQGNSLGLPATISGNSINLMQQSAALKFLEIQEGNAQANTSATYYLASFSYINEEDLHFKLSVSPKENATKSFELSFTRKLYTEK